MRRSLVRAVGTAALILLSAAPGHGAEPDGWRPLRKKAKAAITRAGGFSGKERIVAALSREDHAKAAEMLVAWSVGSIKFVKKVLRPIEIEATEDFDKTERILLKTFEKMPPNRTNEKNLWTAKRAARDTAVANVQAEVLLQSRIGSALERMASEEAARWLASKGLKKLAKVHGTHRAQVGAVRAMLSCKGLMRAAIASASSRAHPEIQVDVFRRLGEVRPPGGIPALQRGLTFAHPSAQRAAIAALRSYDDPQSVQGIIKSFTVATGTAAQELEALLHYFTGQSFDADGRVWQQWWNDNGEAWLASVSATRHPPREATRTSTGTTFYNIPTRSQRIVFVLDRSGSMSKAANQRTRAEAPKGPVTGGDPNEPMDKNAGSTRIEIAKRELERSVQSLAANVYFNLVFYSDKVQVWQDPPHLVAATKENKAKAIAWFMALEAKGGTALFDAIMRGLDFAVPAQSDDKAAATLGGADTMFLLSDGSPTAGGKVLPQATQDELLAKFLAANKRPNCVVHTIGIGKGHNPTLMKRIAAGTGGTYVAAGD